MAESALWERIVVPIVVVFVPLIWQFTAWAIRRAQFRNLILREIEEVGPYPLERSGQNGNWTDHHAKKQFIHRQIFENPTENRDFILSLAPDLVYCVQQLWSSQDNHEQWMYLLFKIQGHVPFWQQARRRKIEKVRRSWYALISEYGVEFKADSRTFLPTEDT